MVHSTTYLGHITVSSTSPVLGSLSGPNPGRFTRFAGATGSFTPHPPQLTFMGSPGRAAQELANLPQYRFGIRHGAAATTSWRAM